MSRLILFFSLLILLLSSTFSLSLAQGLAGQVVVATLNVRSDPSVNDANLIAKIGVGRVFIDGRNEAGDWLFIRTEDGSVTGWVASRYVSFDTNQLPNLPISNGSAPIPQGDSAPVVPPANVPAASQALIMETPILHNMTTSTVYEIFAQGRALGNNPRVFMKVGDSVTATQPFMIGFGNGEYNLGAYSNLQASIDFFNVSPAPRIANSFVHTGVAAVNGFVSGAVFDGTWSPEYCGKLVPLHCEYDILRPSVAIVLFGGQDVRLFDAGFLQNNLRKIAVDLKKLGVIPVFTTFPMHPSYRYEDTILFNTVVISVANEHNIPLINLYRALQALPEAGTKPNDPVHLTQGETFFSFNGEETQYGVTLRNLLTLQALDILRQEVLQR